MPVEIFSLFWKGTTRGFDTVPVASGSSWSVKITVPSGEKWLVYASLSMLPATAGVYGTGSLRVGVAAIIDGVYGPMFSRCIRDITYESEPTVAGWFLLEEGDQLEFFAENGATVDYAVRYGYSTLKL